MVRGEGKDESDVDILVEFENAKKSFDWTNIFAPMWKERLSGVKSDEVFIKHILDEK